MLPASVGQVPPQPAAHPARPSSLAEVHIASRGQGKHPETAHLDRLRRGQGKYYEVPARLRG